jgi:hypothetical protein
MSVGNLGRRDKFLFRQNIRQRYDTTPDQLRNVLARIRTAVSEQAASVQSAALRAPATTRDSGSATACVQGARASSDSC